MADARHRGHVRFGAADTRRGPQPEFVGRTDELAVLRSLLDVSGQHATVVSVVGEPGIGKSRLITEALRGTERDVPAAGAAEVSRRVLLERIGVGAPRPLRSVDSTAAQLRPAVGVLPADEVRTLRAGLTELVTEPAVLVLDDLHRADAALLEFVQSIVAQPLTVPLVLVVGYRPSVAPAELLTVLAGGMAGGTVAEIALGPLDAGTLAELTGLAHGADGLAELVADSAGNPRWAQFAAGGVAVDVAVRAELAALPAGHLVVLESLAVLDPGADLSLLTALCPAELAAELGAQLGELTATGLVVHDQRSATLRFRHPRVRELVYAGINPAAKLAAHRRAAQVLQDAGGPAERRAGHLEHLGTELAPADVAALSQAAREVLWRRPAAAARWLDAALRARPENWPGDADPATARILLGQALALAGDLPAARVTLHEALASVDDLQPEQRWQAAAASGLVERFLGRYPEAAQLLGAAARQPGGEPSSHVLAVENATIALLDNNYPNVARHLDELARTLPVATPNTRLAVLTIAGLGAASQVDIPAAVGYLDEAAALVDVASDPALLDSVEAVSRLAWAEAYVERFADAGRHFRRGVELAESSGQAALLPQLLLGEAQILLWTRSLPAAQRACARALELAGDSGSGATYSFALAISAHLQTWASECGQSAHAVATAEEAVACANRRTLWGQTAVAMLACAQVMAGHPDRCVATFLELSGGVELTETQPMYRTLWYRTMSGASVLAGDLAAAQDYAERAAAHANEELASHRALRAAARADVLAVTGKLDEALEDYRLAVAEFERCDWALYRDWTLTTCGTLLVTLGRPEQAGEWLRRGRAGAERSGVYAIVALADVALATVQAIEPEQPETAAPLQVLTPRQREIVELVVAGHSNRDVAGRLSLSARTVESHLANAYRAMGVSSRAELMNSIAGQRIRPLPGDAGVRLSRTS